MIATFINILLVLVGSAVGLIFRNRISPRFSAVLTQALGLCVAVIGITSAIGTKNTLCVIVCMAAGAVLGEGLRLEDRMDGLGEFIRRRLMKKGQEGRFTEGFVTASVLYCVGAMAINGALAAGLNGDYSILISKGVIDGITSVTLSAALGVGVACAVVPILIYQGGLTLLAGLVGPYLAAATVTEMSAVGGVIILGIALNMLGLGKVKIKAGNLLPAIFLPLLYLPLSQWLGTLLGG